MFENIEIIDNINGSATIIFDLTEEEVNLLEDALGVSSKETVEFEKSFQNFVNEAIISYLKRP